MRIKALLLTVAALSCLSAGATDVFLGNNKSANEGKIAVVDVGAEPITLYDGSSASDNVSYTNYATGVCFKTDPGTKLTLNFDSFDAKNVNCYLYSKKIDSIEITEEWDDWEEDYVTTPQTPAGWDVYYYNGKTLAPFETETGYLTVVWIPRTGYSYSGTGIVATVTAEAPGDMVLTSTVFSNGVNSAFAGQKNVPLYSLKLTTAKNLNPLSITEFSYDASGMGDNVSNVAVKTRDASGAYTPVELAGYELKSGANEFFFVGDINAAAADGATVGAPSVTSLKVAGNDVAPDVSGISEITVSSDILMPGDKSWPVISVGSDRNFYDAGGATAQIPLESEGTVTFVPADSSKKIKINFSEWEIFVATIAGNGDIFRIYDGTGTDASKLIGEYTENPGMVKSADESGALTIYYKSKSVSSFTQKDGWKAIVSQFEEAPMTLQGVTAESAVADGATATENQKALPLIYFNILTEDALNPKKLTAVKLTGVGSAAKGALYFLGKTKDAAAVKAENLLGETTLGATAQTITAEQVFAEGDNWFAVTVDVADGASDGETAGVTLGDVTVDGEVSQSEGTKTASVTVDNTCVLTDGSHSHKISSRWVLRSEQYEYNENRYAPGSSDRIVTFYPTDPSGKVELNISEFDIYYASASYGTRAKFEVRSGSSTGAKLWELKSATDKTTGPGVPLVSTAADGSLTVIFNPNTSSTSYTGKGFKGEVRQIVPKPMRVTGVEVAQQPEGVSGVAAGTKNARLLDINILTEGNTDKKVLKAVNLTLKGNEVLDRISLLSSGASRDFANAAEVAVVDAPESTVSLPCDLELLDGDNRLWITFDLGNDIDSDVVIDAAVDSLTFANNETFAVENGDPDGHRVSQNICILKSDTTVVTVARRLQFYDDGGPDGNISTSFSGVTVFVPAHENEVIRIDTPEDGFAFGAHTMSVYNGRTISEETLLGSFSGVVGPQGIISTSDDGVLTVVVRTLSAPSVAGFHVEVSPYTKQPLAADSLVCAATGHDYAMRGSNCVPLAMASFKVTGETDTLRLTAVNAAVEDAAGALSNLRSFWTTAPSFVADNEFGDAVGQARENAFADSLAIVKKGTYYLWLTGDVAADAQAGAKVSGRITSVKFGDTELIAEGDAAEVEIRAGLSGTYTIGKGGDYANFTLATRALGDGIEGAVTFEVLDGTYPENIVISDVRGTSSSSPITFKAQSGNRAAVVVTGSMPAASNNEYGTHKEGMVLVERTPYVNFSSMTFQPTQGMEYPSVMNIYDSSTHVSVDDCAFSAQQYYDPEKAGVKLIYVESPTDENHTCDYFSVTNSTFNGGHCAMSLQGSGYVSHRYLQHVTVENNVITNPYFQGIYVNTVDSIRIAGNTIENRNQCKEDFRGIDIFLAGFTLEANRIVLESTESSVRGINVRNQGGGTVENPGYVVNNVIALPAASQTYHHGIDINASSKHVKFLHNTVAVNGTGGYPLGIEGNPSSSAGMEFSANLFQNFAGNAAVFISYPEYFDTTLGKMSWNHNTYYGSSVADSGDSNATGIDDYSAKSSDNSSLFYKVNFAGTTNLRPLENSDSISVALNPLVPADADGRERSATTTRGAYQFRPMSTEKPVIADGYPQFRGATVSSVTLAVKWNVPGDLYSMALPADAAAPAAEVLLQQPYEEIQGETEKLVTVGDLSEKTSYKVYFLLSTVMGGNSEMVASETVNTLGGIVPLSVEIPEGYVTVNAGESVNLVVSATGGDEESPYTYTWYDQMDNEVGSSETLSIEPEVSGTYYVEVLSADGQTAWSKVKVRVENAPLAVATFEDNALEPESSWRWDRRIPSLADDSFFSGSLEFANSSIREHSTFGGFGFANESSAEFVDFSHVMRNAAGGGASETQGYGVAGSQESTVTVTNDAEGSVIPGLYINNTAMTVDAVVNGTASFGKFAEGDFVEVEIAGYNADGSREERIIVPLVDFRSGKEETVTDWQYVDLTSLGKVRELKFFVYSSQDPDFTPSFCIDQVGAENPVSGISTVGADGLQLELIAEDVLAVRCESSCRVDIYNVAGMLAETAECRGSSAVSVKDLPAGVYVARAYSESGTAVLRFVKH